MNINHLGEAVLGEEEALYRLEKYVETLKSPEVEYISVKISTIYSQIHADPEVHRVLASVSRGLIPVSRAA